MQTEFKEVHKQVEQVRQSGSRPSELKAEIAQLEQDSIQLKSKIQKMKKDMNVDENYFKDMLNVKFSFFLNFEYHIITLLN